MANSNQTHHSLKTDEPMDTDSPCNNENLRAHNSSITDGHIFIPEETMDTDSARMVSELGSGHSAVSDRMTTETTLVSEPGNGEERDQEKQYSSTDKDSSRRNGEECDQEKQYSSTDKDSSRRNGEERDQEKQYSSTDKDSSRRNGEERDQEKQYSSTDKDSSRRNGEERDQEEQYSSTDKHSSRRNGEERDQEEQYSSTDKHSSRRNGEERDQEEQYLSTDKHSSRRNGEECDQEKQYSSTDQHSSRRNGEERDQEKQYSSTDKHSSRRNGEERDQEKQYSSADKHSSQSSGRRFIQGLCVKGYNFISGNKNDTSSSPDATKEYDHDKQGSSKVKMPKPPQPCFECDIKDEEIKRLRNQTYQFMMEIELHLEGRDVKKLSLEYQDLFNDQTQKVADIVESETLPCKLFQACYDVVHKTVIELCGTHMECLFKVYGDTAIPADMKDIKNEKCRCYIKLVSAFEMNHDKKCTLEDLKTRLERHLKEHVPEWTTLPHDYIKNPQLNSFLTESLKLSWKLATCVPPMIVTCDEKRYDRKIHDRISVKEEVPDKYTLKYHSPTLYTNYTGHVQAKGLVEIISDSVSEINQPLKSITGPEKPSLELVMTEVSDELKDVVMLQNFARELGMPQNKIDLVFRVTGAEIKDNLHQIITWWINRRRIQPQWDKLADAVESTGYHGLAARIRQKYCESHTARVHY